MQVLWLSFYFPGPVAVGTPTQTSYSTHHMDGPTYFLQSGNWNSKCRLWYKKICCISLVVDWYMSGIWLVHLFEDNFWLEEYLNVSWCLWMVGMMHLTHHYLYPDKASSAQAALHWFLLWLFTTNAVPYRDQFLSHQQTLSNLRIDNEPIG